MKIWRGWARGLYFENFELLPRHSNLRRVDFAIFFFHEVSTTRVSGWSEDRKPDEVEVWPTRVSGWY